MLGEDSQPSVVCVTQGLPNWQGSTRGKQILMNFAIWQISNSIAVLIFNVKREPQGRTEAEHSA